MFKKNKRIIIYTISCLCLVSLIFIGSYYLLYNTTFSKEVDISDANVLDEYTVTATNFKSYEIKISDKNKMLDAPISYQKAIDIAEDSAKNNFGLILEGIIEVNTIDNNLWVINCIKKEDDTSSYIAYIDRDTGEIAREYELENEINYYVPEEEFDRIIDEQNALSSEESNQKCITDAKTFVEDNWENEYNDLVIAWLIEKELISQSDIIESYGIFTEYYASICGLFEEYNGEFYRVEVAVNDEKYIAVNIKKETNVIFGYSKYNQNFINRINN